jgi:hypothetical protein
MAYKIDANGTVVRGVSLRFAAGCSMWMLSEADSPGPQRTKVILAQARRKGPGFPRNPRPISLCLR